MEMRPITFSIAAVSIAASAGIGAYLAVRHNAAESGAATVAESTTATATATTVPAAGGETGFAAGLPPVESTEQVVAADTPPAPSAAAPETPPPADVERVARRAPAARPAPPRDETRPVGGNAPAAARPEGPAASQAPSDAPEAPPSRPERPDAAPEPAARQRDTAPEPEPPAPEPAPAERPTSNPPARGERELPEIDGWRRVERPSPPGPGPLASADVTRLDHASLRVTELDPSGAPAEPDPTVPATDQLVIPVDSVIGLQLDTFVTSDRAQVEDDVQARVTRDVFVADRVVFPAGLIVKGSVVAVERGGKLSGASRLGVRFHSVVLDDGLEVPIATETVFRQGRSPGRDSAAKVSGGAVAGAILGAIFGGGRGAAIGGAAGAAGGAAAAGSSDAEPATLAAGAALTVRLSQPATVTVER